MIKTTYFGHYWPSSGFSSERIMCCKRRLQAVCQSHMDTRTTTCNTTKTEHTHNEENITRTHQQQGATGHIRNTKRDTRVQHTRKYQLFIYLLVTRGKSHSTELPTRTHTLIFLLLPQKLPSRQAYSIRTQEANTSSTTVTYEGETLY